MRSFGKSSDPQAYLVKPLVVVRQISRKELLRSLNLKIYWKYIKMAGRSQNSKTSVRDFIKKYKKEDFLKLIMKFICLVSVFVKWEIFIKSLASQYQFGNPKNDVIGVIGYLRFLPIRYLYITYKDMNHKKSFFYNLTHTQAKSTFACLVVWHYSYSEWW